MIFQTPRHPRSHYSIPSGRDTRRRPSIIPRSLPAIQNITHPLARTFRRPSRSAPRPTARAARPQFKYSPCTCAPPLGSTLECAYARIPAAPLVPTRFRPLAMSAPHSLSPDPRARWEPDGATPFGAEPQVARRSRSPWRRWRPAAGARSRSRSPSRLDTTVDEMQVSGIPPLPAGSRRDPSLTLRFVTRSEARRLDEAHLDEERGEAVAPHQLANTAVVAAVAPQQPPDSAVVSAVAPQLSDEELSRRYVSLGILAAQRGPNAPLSRRGRARAARGSLGT